MVPRFIDTLKNNFKSTNDSIENGFNVFNEPFEEILLKIDDNRTKIVIQTKFETLQQTIIAANKKFKENTISHFKQVYDIKREIVNLCDDELSL